MKLILSVAMIIRLIIGNHIVPYAPNPSNAPARSNARLVTKQTDFEPDAAIEIGYSGAKTNDWMGVFEESSYPEPNAALFLEYISGDGTVKLEASMLEADKYYCVYLCTQGGYRYVDCREIYIADDDFTDYGAQAVTLDVSHENGVSKVCVTVTPSSEKELEYRLYWSCDGSALDGFEPIKVIRHSGSAPFEIRLNEGIFMPDSADSVTVKVRQGHSTPASADAPDSLKAAASELLYSYAVLTDIHIDLNSPKHISNFTLALDEINSLYPDIAAVFTCGDNTNSGEDAQYELLMDTLQSRKPAAPVYFAMGNHDFIGEGKTMLNRINTFRRYTGMPNSYYSVDVKGTKCIFLASDRRVMGEKINFLQMCWLKNELKSIDKNDRVMIFMHQPLIDTVSGSLYSLDKEKQDWYGFSADNKRLRALLADYPNAFVFSGHTHWTFDSVQPVLLGRGSDANFVNCASVGYLWNDDDMYEKGSECMFVEVYEDYVLLKPRELVNGSWCSAAQILVPTVK